MKIQNAVAVICVIGFSLNLMACGGAATEDKIRNVVKNDNEEYQEIIQIDCYENYDPSVDTSTFAPKAGRYDGWYALEIGNTMQTMSFNYQGHKYYGPLGPGRYSITAEYKVDKFYEIRDLILEDNLENYEYSFDEDGKLVSTLEDYYFVIVYVRPATGKKIHMAIKTPSNKAKIVTILDEMLVSNAKHENLLHLED